jgi:rhomboid protease GluP
VTLSNDMTSNEEGSAPPLERPGAPAIPEEVAEFRGRLFQVTPGAWLVPALVAANVAVFLLMVVKGVSFMAPKGEELIAWGANFGPRTLGGQWWRLFTSMFLHSGVIHLGLNMYVFWNGGRFVERLYGHLELALVYLVAGLAGSLLSVAMHPQGSSVGASGAIFGVYGALGAFLVVQRASLPRSVVEGLKKSAITFVGYNLVYGFVLPNVDMSAHFGGLAGGFLAGALLARPIVVGRPRAYGRILLAVLLALALVGATRLLPPAVDVQALRHEVGAEEKRILGIYNGLVEDSNAKTPAAQFAKAIDEQVLPPWRALHARVAAPGRLTAHDQKVFAQLERYLAAREEGWQSLVVALRATDPIQRSNFNEQAKQSEQRANAAIKELEKINR